MKEGNAAVLVMKKVLGTGKEIDKRKFLCEVLRYDSKQETIYLVMKKDVLPAISLDAIYECNIKEEENLIACTGRVQERYYNEHGKILKLKIKNGFYKINVKSVDK